MSLFFLGGGGSFRVSFRNFRRFSRSVGPGVLGSLSLLPSIANLLFPFRLSGMRGYTAVCLSFRSVLLLGSRMYTLVSHVFVVHAVLCADMIVLVVLWMSEGYPLFDG